MTRPAAAKILCALLLALPLSAHALLGFGGKKDLPVVSASVASAQGDVQLQQAAAPGWIPAATGKLLSSGDALKTGASGSAVIAFSDGTKLSLGPNSSQVMERLQPGRVEVNLSIGLIEAWVKKLAGRRFTVRTPTAVASVRGTEFRAEVDASGRTTVDLFGGSLDLTDHFGNQTSLDSGQRIVADVKAGVAEAKPVPIPPEVKPKPEPAVALPPPPKAEEGGKKPETAPVKAEASKAKIVSFTGTLVITLADGKKISVKPGEPIPDIPPGATITVTDGVAVVASGDQAMEVKAGTSVSLSPEGTFTTAGAAPATTTEAAPTETTTMEAPPPPKPAQEMSVTSPSTP
ncbi:MAG: FecR domain-containing protein [Elusimicrobia bacterium]|nr:FecR domain-containing protein [Elusimicrobiota bacterium]